MRTQFFIDVVVNTLVKQILIQIPDKLRTLLRNLLCRFLLRLFCRRHLFRLWRCRHLLRFFRRRHLLQLWRCRHLLRLFRRRHLLWLWRRRHLLRFCCRCHLLRLYCRRHLLRLRFPSLFLFHRFASSLIEQINCTAVRRQRDVKLSLFLLNFIQRQQVNHSISNIRNPDPQLGRLTVVINRNHNRLLISDPRKCILPVCQKQLPVPAISNHRILLPERSELLKEFFQPRDGRVLTDLLQVDLRPKPPVSVFLPSADAPL